MMQKTDSLPDNTADNNRWIASDYTCPRWIVGGHAQTLWPVLQPRPTVVFRRERVATPDHDFWDFDWLDAPAKEGAPLVVLFHGLEGSSHSHYACSLMEAAAQRGWRGVVPHFRGCSGEINHAPRAYHMGDYSEVGAILLAIRARVPENTLIYAAGVSLGGSALLNWLGRAGQSNGTGGDPIVDAAATISTPIDLAASGKVLDEGINRHIYERNFMSTLRPKALTMARRYPDKLDAKKIALAQTLTDFDNVVTAPLHGFKDVADYRHRASSRPWLSKISVPTLLLNALNDPLVPARSLPGIEETSEHVFIERTTDGGHAGFPSATPAKAWMPQRILSFFENTH